MSGTQIAAQVSAAIAQAGALTGNGRPLVATLHKPGAMTGPAHSPTPGAGSQHPLTVVDLTRLERDAAGGLTGQVTHRLLVAADGARPEKADRIAVGTDPPREVVSVAPLAPGGTVLLYEVIVDG